MTSSRCLTFLVLAANLGCGASDAPAPSVESPSARPEYEVSSTANADAPGAIFRLTVRGGEHAGDYELESHDPEPCQIGMLGKDLFTVNASGEPPQLRYAEVRIPGFAPGDGVTDEFGFAAKTADFDLWIDTTPDALRPGGSGNLTWRDDGENDIQIELEGRSGDDVDLRATMECKRVGR